MSVKLARLYTRLGFGSPSPLLKQAPMTALFIVAIVIVIVAPGVQVSNSAAVAGSTVAMVVATVLAGILSYKEQWRHLSLIVPSIDLLAVAALRYGSGEAVSMFAAFVILPVVWFAAEPGRYCSVFGTLGAAVVSFTPFFLGKSVLGHEAEFMRAFFSCVVFGIAAAVINELSRQGRLQVEKVKRFAEQSRLMLAESREQATELARSEAKVRATEQLFRGLWEAITEQSVIGTDVTGLIDAWNPGAAKMFGLTSETTVDKRHVDDFHLKVELMDRARELDYPAGATVLNPGFSALVETARLGAADVREWTYMRDDGARIPVELSVTARVDGMGETVGYLFVAYDMTKAREVARLKDEFVGLISHELRTPLSSILGYLELLRDDDEVPLSDRQLRYLGVAERNAHRLLRLVGDLLFTAQVESGTFHLDEREQYLGPILAASVESARPAATAAGISLNLDVVDDVLINADSVRLGQACDNLISNAIKFTPSGGTVTVGLTGSTPRALITVTDTGMGIAADELDKLFSRFFRATTATRNAVSGVGLGLVITRAIARAHGGDMGVTSEEGVGTVFSMTLPLVEPANA
jgi:signal transduction histidine kinase